jgi:hypothetical protein
MSEIFQAISATKAAIDGVRSLHQYADEVKDVSKRGEFMRIIGELSLELAETQLKLSGHIRENDELKEQVVILQKKVETLENPDSKLICKNDVYYDSKSNDGPFCIGCYDNNRKKIRLSNLPYAKKALGKYECPTCKSNYGRYGNSHQKSNAGILIGG